MFSTEETQASYLIDTGDFADGKHTSHFVDKDGSPQVRKERIYNRPMTHDGYVPPPRCPYIDDNARQCTYTQAACPGHRRTK